MNRDRVFRLTANPLAEPADLDHGYVAKIHTMLDAFAATSVPHSQLSLHESSADGPLAYAVVAWAVGRYAITVNLTTSHGRTYEVWHVGDDWSVIVFPRERLLYGLDPDLQSKIDRVRREADERIRSLIEAETKVAANPAPSVEDVTTTEVQP